MPEPDKYLPGEALTDALSRKNIEFYKANLETRPQLVKYLDGVINSLLLVAPSITIDRSVKRLLAEWQLLIDATNNKLIGITDKKIFIEAKKISVSQLCLAFLEAIDLFDKKDLKESDLDLLKKLTELKSFGVNSFYQQTIKQLSNKISDKFAD